MAAKITAFKVLGKKKQRIQVYLDGAEWVELDPETVVRERLTRGQMLDAEAQERILRTDEMIRARKAAAGYAAGGRKTHRELEQYLRRRQFSAQAVADALAALAESGTIHDRQVASRHLAQRRRKRDMGPRRLEAELTARGISPPEAEALVRHELEGVDLREECRQLARAAARRYQPLNDLKQQRKLAAWLMRRGYDGECVKAAIDSLVDGSDALSDEI